MLESALIAAIHKHLPKELHHQSMTSASQMNNGTPDRYYDGAHDLWVEYKSLTAMPRSGRVGGVDNKKRGCYSALQFEWMLRRYTNSKHLPHGPNVVGIVGLPNRTAVIQRTPTDWCEGSPTAFAIPIQEVSFWIVDFCGPFSVLSENYSSARRLSTARIKQTDGGSFDDIEKRSVRVPHRRAGRAR